MRKYIFRRILLSIPVLFAVIVVTFGLSHTMPGGPFDGSGNSRRPAHIRAQLEQRFGLNKPVFFNAPSDGKGSEIANGKTVTVKGHSDAGYTTQIFDEPEDAGIKLYGEYDLIDNGAENCVGQRVEPGWALIARRQRCIVIGGDQSSIRTEVRKVWVIDPLDSQFSQYMLNVLRLDFGPSLNEAFVRQNRQVTDIISDRVPVSMQLGIFSTLVGFSLGIPLGVIAAVYHNTFVDYSATFFAVFGQSIPAIVLAPILILIFAVQLDIVPSPGGTDSRIWKEDNPFDPAFINNTLLEGEFDEYFSQLFKYAQILVLPVFTIGTGMSAGIARLTRATLLQVLNEDYIRTARSKGLRERRITYIHALKNALIPVVTAVGPLLAGIVAGSFVIELIFSIPGMGKTFIEAVQGRDYTTIMGVTIFFSTILIAGNLLVDIMYTWLDPRIRFD